MSLSSIVEISGVTAALGVTTSSTLAETVVVTIVSSLFVTTSNVSTAAEEVVAVSDVVSWPITVVAAPDDVASPAADTPDIVVSESCADSVPVVG